MIIFEAFHHIGLLIVWDETVILSVKGLLNQTLNSFFGIPSSTYAVWGTVYHWNSSRSSIFKLSLFGNLICYMICFYFATWREVLLIRAASSLILMISSKNSRNIISIIFLNFLTNYRCSVFVIIDYCGSHLISLVWNFIIGCTFRTKF